MKSLLIVIAVLIGNAAASAELSGTMRQPYIYCTATDYSVILENAAVGEATSIELIQSQKSGWKTLVQAPITKMTILPAGPAPGAQARYYEGPGFTATRNAGLRGNLWSDILDLKIELNGVPLNMTFDCSTVE